VAAPRGENAVSVVNAARDSVFGWPRRAPSGSERKRRPSDSVVAAPRGGLDANLHANRQAAYWSAKKENLIHFDLNSLISLWRTNPSKEAIMRARFIALVTLATVCGFNIAQADDYDLEVYVTGRIWDAAKKDNEPTLKFSIDGATSPYCGDEWTDRDTGKWCEFGFVKPGQHTFRLEIAKQGEFDAKNITTTLDLNPSRLRLDDGDHIWCLMVSEQEITFLPSARECHTS
jgi:hypothetical protein